MFPRSDTFRPLHKGAGLQNRSVKATLSHSGSSPDCQGGGSIPFYRTNKTPKNACTTRLFGVFVFLLFFRKMQFLHRVLTQF